MKTRVQKIAEKVAKKTDTELVYMRDEGFMYVLRFEQVVPGGIAFFQQRLSEEVVLAYSEAELIKMIADNVSSHMDMIANEKRLDQ